MLKLLLSGKNVLEKDWNLVEAGLPGRGNVETCLWPLDFNFVYVFMCIRARFRLISASLFEAKDMDGFDPLLLGSVGFLVAMAILIIARIVKLNLDERKAHRRTEAMLALARAEERRERNEQRQPAGICLVVHFF